MNVWLMSDKPFYKRFVIFLEQTERQKWPKIFLQDGKHSKLHQSLDDFFSRIFWIELTCLRLQFPIPWLCVYTFFTTLFKTLRADFICVRFLVKNTDGNLLSISEHCRRTFSIYLHILSKKRLRDLCHHCPSVHAITLIAGNYLNGAWTSRNV